jgi:NAD(P)H dehydrogenase (quinone)
MRIAVTGANGEFGRGVIDLLAELVPASDLIATVRDADKSADLRERGIEVRPGSFDEPSRLEHAFDGADVVLVNATFFGVEPQLRGTRFAAAIDAAVGAGAQRVVLTSWPDLEHTDLVLVQDYAASEAHLRETAPRWAILRMGFGLSDALARDIAWARRDGELTAPAHGARTAPAAPSDLAAATAHALTATDLDGTVYELTGTRTIDWRELAALASEIEGATIAYREVDEAGYREYLDGHGIPAAFADGLLDLYAAYRSGWASTPTGTLEQLLRRAPIDPIEVVRRRATRP